MIRTAQDPACHLGLYVGHKADGREHALIKCIGQIKGGGWRLGVTYIPYSFALSYTTAQAKRSITAIHFFLELEFNKKSKERERNKGCLDFSFD